MKSFLIFIFCSIFLSQVIELSSQNNLDSATNEEYHRYRALKILESKCNVCHKMENSKRVFTIENMDDFGKKIYKQVFKWKRMPKGNDNNLTQQERKQLENWLSSINIIK